MSWLPLLIVGAVAYVGSAVGTYVLLSRLVKR